MPRTPQTARIATAAINCGHACNRRHRVRARDSGNAERNGDRGHRGRPQGLGRAWRAQRPWARQRLLRPRAVTEFATDKVDVATVTIYTADVAVLGHPQDGQRQGGIEALSWDGLD